MAGRDHSTKKNGGIKDSCRLSFEAVIPVSAGRQQERT